jgi:hypothetical protein
MLVIQATHVTHAPLSSPLRGPDLSTTVSIQPMRNDRINNCISTFLNRMGYQRDAEPVIVDMTLEVAVLADIKAKGIEVEERRAKEIARLGAVMANVGVTAQLITYND